MASLMVFLNTAAAFLPHDSLQRRLDETHLGTQCAQRPTGLKAYSQNDRTVIVAQRSRPYRHRTQTTPEQVQGSAEHPRTECLPASPQPSPRSDRIEAEHFYGSEQPHRSSFAASPLSRTPPSPDHASSLGSAFLLSHVRRWQTGSRRRPLERSAHLRRHWAHQGRSRVPLPALQRLGGALYMSTQRS